MLVVFCSNCTVSMALVGEEIAEGVGVSSGKVTRGSSSASTRFSKELRNLRLGMLFISFMLFLNSCRSDLTFFSRCELEDEEEDVSTVVVLATLLVVVVVQVCEFVCN